MNFIVPVEAFNQDVMFHFGDLKKLKKELDKYCDKELVEQAMQYIRDKAEEGVSTGHTLDLQSGQLVYLYRKPDNAAGIAVLAHEITHVVFLILAKAGIEYCKESEEVYAYLVEYLMREVLRKVGK